MSEVDVNRIANLLHAALNDRAAVRRVNSTVDDFGISAIGIHVRTEARAVTRTEVEICALCDVDDPGGIARLVTLLVNLPTTEPRVTPPVCQSRLPSGTQCQLRYNHAEFHSHPPWRWNDALSTVAGPPVQANAPPSSAVEMVMRNICGAVSGQGPQCYLIKGHAGPHCGDGGRLIWPPLTSPAPATPRPEPPTNLDDAAERFRLMELDLEDK